MPAALHPDVAQAAVALRRSHAHASAIDVLDLVMEGRTGRLADLGEIDPCSPFGMLLVEAFDRGLAPDDWKLLKHPNTSPNVVHVLMGIWDVAVMAPLAKRYGFAIG